jgi:hypothetical protein
MEMEMEIEEVDGGIYSESGYGIGSGGRVSVPGGLSSADAKLATATAAAASTTTASCIGYYTSLEYSYYALNLNLKLQ